MKEEKEYIQIRIEKSIKKDFFEKAEENSQTPSMLIRNWIKEYIKGDTKNDNI